jgi:3'(2'), 5'-bisphosphate nucleotidase
MPKTLASDERVQIASAAILAGLRALQVILRHPSARVPVDKPDGSPVTAGDLAVQMAVASVLRRRAPQWALVGEEGEGSVPGAEGAALLARAVAAVRESLGTEAPADPAELLQDRPSALDEVWWTVDPIDGTKGFRSGRHYALCLALVERGEATVGVLSCPTLVIGRDPLEIGADDQMGTVYVAAKGQGAWKFAPCAEDRSLPTLLLPVVRSVRRAEGAPWRVCDSIEGGSRAERMRVIMNRTPLRWESVSLDSQCKYALVAEGAADCFMRVPGSRGAEKIWDHAPGAVVASEAGAWVGDLVGTPLRMGGEALDQNVGTLACDRSISVHVHEAARAVLSSSLSVRSTRGSSS